MEDKKELQISVYPFEIYISLRADIKKGVSIKKNDEGYLLVSRIVQDFLLTPEPQQS